MDFVFVIVLAVPLHTFSSQLNFCQYSHTALECTVACNSSPADLAAYQHTQDLLNKFKRCIALFHRLVPAGSKAMLWLSDQICAVSSKYGEAKCNFKTFDQYVFLMESHRA